MKLQILRVVLAIISFSLLTFFFLDFAGLFPQQYFTLAKIQFFPALLSGMFGIVAVLLALTLIFGRVYCSMICPFGIFMDVVTWFRKRFQPKMKASYSKEKKWLRFGTLIVVVGSYSAGVTAVLSLLEPYSAYGRIVTHIFRPVYMAGNNLLASVFNQLGSYTFYHTNVFIHSITSLLIALATLSLVVILAALYGRTWCNTVCPVGTIFGYLSKLSLFKVRINKNTCIGCGLCEKACKASCIDSQGKIIDQSRCVACYNCLTSCKKGGISYCLPGKKQPLSKPVPVDESKRRFVGTLAATTLAIPATLVAQNLNLPSSKTSYKKQYPLSPPGSCSSEHLLRHCTACHLCIAKCPSNVLKPAFLEYGLEGIMQPVMDFEHGFCNYDCTVCSEVCPTDALFKLTIEEKHTLQMGRVVFIKNNCVVFTDETSCGACSEHCPTQAVEMVPYKDNLTIPSINPDICVGCGGCEYICPATPYKAIHVEGNPVHLEAKPYEETDNEEVVPDSFGF